jgi:hypothetical protein
LDLDETLHSREASRVKEGKLVDSIVASDQENMELRSCCGRGGVRT